MASRQAYLALATLATAALAGCHAGTSGGVSSRPEPILPKVSPTVAQAIEKHNENALKVVALDAQPKIIVSAPGVANGFKTDGHMALERPKNFKLVLTSLRGQVADIGSNDDEFWFWTQNKQDRSVYVCSYNDIDRAPLSAAFQPDWIVESMGLRAISKEEAAGMRIERGDLPGTFKLISTRAGRNGAVMTKVSIIDTTGQVREHRLYQGEGRNQVLIASAVVEKTQVATLPDTEETVVLPANLRLNWVQEKLALEIQLGRVQLSSGFAESRRQATFIEPDDPNLKRTNLATLEAPAGPAAGRSRAAEPARTRTSRFAPKYKTGVEFGDPEPLGSRQTPRAAVDRGPVALANDEPAPSRPRGDLDRVYRPELPRPSDRD